MLLLEQANGHFNDAFSGMHATRSFSLQPEQVSGVLTPLYHTDRLECGKVVTKWPLLHAEVYGHGITKSRSRGGDGFAWLLGPHADHEQIEDHRDLRDCCHD